MDLTNFMEQTAPHLHTTRRS